MSTCIRKCLVEYLEGPSQQQICPRRLDRKSVEPKTKAVTPCDKEHHPPKILLDSRWDQRMGRNTSKCVDRCSKNEPTTSLKKHLPSISFNLVPPMEAVGNPSVLHSVRRHPPSSALWAPRSKCPVLGRDAWHGASRWNRSANTSWPETPGSISLGSNGRMLKKNAVNREEYWEMPFLSVSCLGRLAPLDTSRLVRRQNPHTQALRLTSLESITSAYLPQIPLSYASLGHETKGNSLLWHGLFRPSISARTSCDLSATQQLANCEKVWVTNSPANLNSQDG